MKKCFNNSYIKRKNFCGSAKWKRSLSINCRGNKACTQWQDQAGPVQIVIHCRRAAREEAHVKFIFFFPQKASSLSFYSFLSFSYCLSLAFRCTLAVVGLGFVSSLAPWQIQLSDNTIVWGPWVMASGVAGQQNGQPAIQTGSQTDVWDIWVTILLATNWTGTALSPQLCVLSSLGRHTQTSH